MSQPRRSTASVASVVVVPIEPVRIVVLLFMGCLGVETAQRCRRIGGPHERLANQHRVYTGGAQAGDVTGVPYPRLGDDHPVAGDPGAELDHEVPIDSKGA